MHFPGGPVVKNPPTNVGDSGSIPGSGRSPKGGQGNPLQYSCLENPLDRGAWQATVHRVTKSWTWQKGLSMHAWRGHGGSVPHALPYASLSLGYSWVFAQPCPSEPTKFLCPSVHRILQARILESVAISSSRGSSRPRAWTQVSLTAARFFTVWATRESNHQNSG